MHPLHREVSNCRLPPTFESRFDVRELLATFLLDLYSRLQSRVPIIPISQPQVDAGLFERGGEDFGHHGAFKVASDGHRLR